MAPRIFLEGLSAAFFCGRVAGGGGSLIRVPSVVECRLVLAPWSALRTQAPARAEREGSVALAPWSALRTQALARAERDCRRTIVGWERGFGAVVRPADTGAGATEARRRRGGGEAETRSERKANDQRKPTARSGAAANELRGEGVAAGARAGPESDTAGVAAARARKRTAEWSSCAACRRSTVGCRVIAERVADEPRAPRGIRHSR